MRSSDGFVPQLRGDLPKRKFTLSPGAGSSEVVAACRTHRAIERPATVISYLIVIQKRTVAPSPDLRLVPPRPRAGP
jgi:hypothetical protein